MIERVIEFCAKNRLLVALATVFACMAAYHAIRTTPLDALPDLSDPQVIVYTEWKGRSPTLVEDQVTYPITAALLSAPRVTDVRAYSMFGMSFVHVLFEEGTDLYWARSRVLEYLSSLRARLPEGVEPRLGPDATGIGWIFQYALVDRAGRHGLAELRAFQDFTLRYALSSVPGVAEVASVGGYEKQYQVTVDPNRLRAYGITLAQVGDAVRRSNGDSGGRLLEMSGREYVIRGRGYVGSLEDLEKVAVGATERGTPILLRDVARIAFGGDIRRGVTDLDGQGEAVGGIVVMRHGENALRVIEAVKEKLRALEPSFPEGVTWVTVYDRSDLIARAVDTLKGTLLEEGIVVALVIVVFLLHFRSALVPIVILPLSVALAFIPMSWLGITSNIMSLGGIAIALGALVDASIVLVENAHKRLERHPAQTRRERVAVVIDAAKEVGPAIFFSLLVVTVSFFPVFALEGQAGRLFSPLAYTKTFAMFFAAVLSVTVAPVLMVWLVRGKIRSEAQHPVSRILVSLYRPMVFVALRNPKTTVAIGAAAVVATIPLVPLLGSEFMPALDEGDLLYMPTTLPNVSIEEVRAALERQDAILRSFPEVVTVFGKAGRAETATDPAPLSMIETVVRLRPRDEWRMVKEERFWSGLPEFLHPAFRWLWPDERRITTEELFAKMNEALDQPGWTNALTMPIKTRVDMLSTGIRTPVGIKVYGQDLGSIESVGVHLERVLGAIPGTRSAFFERGLGGLYLDVVPDREALARHGLHVADVNEVIETAIGGEPVTTTVEGRRRFSVNVRYPRELREDPEALENVLVPIPREGGKVAHIPLGEIARVQIVTGPPMIRSENGHLVGHVYVDLDAATDVGGYVRRARAAVDHAIARGELRLPAGTFLEWSGEWELMERVAERMRWLLPLTLLSVVLLLYLHFRNFAQVAIVLLTIPFAMVGSIWLLWLLDYRLSTAVYVGMIALVGLAAETGIVMMVYLDRAYERRKAAGKMRGIEDVIWAHYEGTVLRVRPKVMTVLTTLIGLMPILWSQGTGADVMKRIAAPMVGGLFSSAFLTLEIIPVVYTWWRQAQLKREREGRGSPLEQAA